MQRQATQFASRSNPDGTVLRGDGSHVVCEQATELQEQGFSVPQLVTKCFDQKTLHAFGVVGLSCFEVILKLKITRDSTLSRACEHAGESREYVAPTPFANAFV